MNPNLPTGETMSEGGQMPVDALPAAKPLPPAPISVPLSYLAQPDAAEQMQTPAKGDSGTMTVDFTITEIQGDMAIVQPNAVNGNALDDEAAEGPTDPDEQEGADLQAMAGKMSV